MVDGCWHQLFEKDGLVYVLRSCSSNSYDEDTIADAGVARDVVVNAIANASEMRIQVDGTKLSRTASEIHTIFGINRLKQAKIPTEAVRLCASESLKHTLDDYRAGYLTVGSFGYYQRIFRLDDIVGDYQSSTHREAMEELAVVGP